MVVCCSEAGSLDLGGSTQILRMYLLASKLRPIYLLQYKGCQIPSKVHIVHIANNHIQG
jgi:hypothetical protein